MEVIIYIIVGLIVGAIVGALVAKNQKSGFMAKIDSLAKENSRLNEEYASLKQEEAEISKEKQDISTQFAVLQSQIANIEQRCQEVKDNALKAESQMQQAHQREIDNMEENQQKLLEAKDKEHESILLAQEKRHTEAVNNLKETFENTIEHLKANLKATTEDLLKSRQEEFSDLNKKNMQGIIDPLNDTIERMKAAMQGYTEKQDEFSGSMKTHIDTIIKQTETASKSAEELTTALKHDTKIQGDYGEAILDEILSKQGFTEGIHYELQYVMKDEVGKELKGDDGKGLRPDVLFHLDTKRDVIIDSKVNLTDFINFANANTPDERKMYLDKHVKSIESQVKLLSQKNYFKYHKKTSSRMDYVIMFVPISAAWWEALRHKPDLWREAMESNVYIADEQTLFAALRIIKLTWTQIAQVNSQKEIFGLVNEMIDRVGQFMKSYKGIGEHLAKAQDAYNKGYEKLSPGGQSILKTTDKLLKLGGRDSKTNPVTKFLDVDDIPELPQS